MTKKKKTNKVEEPEVPYGFTSGNPFVVKTRLDLDDKHELHIPVPAGVPNGEYEVEVRISRRGKSSDTGEMKFLSEKDWKNWMKVQDEEFSTVDEE